MRKNEYCCGLNPLYSMFPTSQRYCVAHLSLLKWSFFLGTCLIHLGCLNVKRTNNTEAAVRNGAPKVPILWTVDYSPNGKYYAVGGNDSLLRLYGAGSHQLLHTFKLPADVQCVDWHNDSKLLAIALAGQPVQLLDITTSTFQQLDGITGSRALDWNHDGSLLAVGDYSNALQIWSKEGRLLKTIKKRDNKDYLTVDWHPSKSIILTGTDKIRIFDTSGNLLHSIKHRMEETAILAVKWHPSGKFFAVGDYGEVENNIASLLQFWSEDGALIKTLYGSGAEYRNIRWNKTGALLATASDALRLWSAQGALLYSGKSEDFLWGIDWDSQREQIVTSSMKGKIKLWSDKAHLIKSIAE